MEDFNEEQLMSGGMDNGVDSDDEVMPGSTGGAAGAQDDGEPAGSALRENIRTKGANSYYYAHKTKIDAPAWDGNEAPRLLAREASKSSEGAPAVAHEVIKTYAWSDEQEKVKIYVTLADTNFKDDDVKLDWSATSLSLLVMDAAGGPRGKVLTLAKLHDEIEDASFRVRSDRITITLKKKGAATWFDLKKDN